MYTLANDTLLITERLTEVFLQRLLQQIDEGEADNGQTMLLTPGTNVTALLETLVPCARDMLPYLRDCKSDALLQMLRDFARRGEISTSDIDPAVLQDELDKLINETRLNVWYGSTTKKDAEETQTRPWTQVRCTSQSDMPWHDQLNGRGISELISSVVWCHGQQQPRCAAHVSRDVRDLLCSLVCCDCLDKGAHLLLGAGTLLCKWVQAMLWFESPAALPASARRHPRVPVQHPGWLSVFQIVTTWLTRLCPMFDCCSTLSNVCKRVRQHLLHLPLLCIQKILCLCHCRAPRSCCL